MYWTTVDALDMTLQLDHSHRRVQGEGCYRPLPQHDKRDRHSLRRMSFLQLLILSRNHAPQDVGCGSHTSVASPHLASPRLAVFIAVCSLWSRIANDCDQGSPTIAIKDRQLKCYNGFLSQAQSLWLWIQNRKRNIIHIHVMMKSQLALSSCILC